MMLLPRGLPPQSWIVLVVDKIKLLSLVVIF